MITLVAPDNAQKFLAASAYDDIIGARMHTLLKCYGTDADFCRLWLATDKMGEPTAAVARFDGWLVISANNRVDLPELGAFAKAIGEYMFVEASPAVCKGLDLKGEYSESHLMRYAGGRHGEDYSAIEETPPLQQVYHLVCTANAWFAATTDWAAWYTHTSHLFRHGMGFAGLIREGGCAVSTGGVYTMSDTLAVIGCLATLPEFRGGGRATLLTKYLIDKILDLGKTPALFCAGDKLADYYAAFGFLRAGKWGEIKL